MICGRRGHGGRPLLGRALRLTAWGSGVGLSFGARRLLEPPHVSLLGWLVYLFGAALVVGSLRRRPAAVGERKTRSRNAPRAALLIAMLAPGVALAAVAYERVRNGNSGGATVTIWIVSVGTVLVAAASGRRRRPLRVRRSVVVEILAVSAILVVAIVLRGYELGTRPPNIHPDEALIGLDARGFLTGQNTDVLTLGFAATPRLSYAIPALAMRLFGNDLFGLRMASAVLGTLAVLLLYALARQLFGVRCALVAASLLAVSEWAVHYSRVGISNEQGVVATLLVILFAVRAADRNTLADWLLTGLAAGFCLEVYQGARLAPLIAFAYLLHRALGTHGFLRTRRFGMVAAMLAAFVFFAPMAGFYARYPQRFNEHGREVAVWTAAARAHEMGAYGVNSFPAVLLEQSRRTLAVLNGAWDAAPHYGGALTDGLSGPLVVLGLLIALPLGLRDSRLFLIAVWSVLTLGSGVVTINALDSTRVVGVMGAFCLAAALVVELGWQAIENAVGRRGVQTFAVAVCVFLAAVAFVNIRDYFERYPASHPPDSATVLGRYARTIRGRAGMYLLPGAGYPIKFETIRFLAPSLDGSDVVSTQPDAIDAVGRALLVVPAWSPDATRERRWIEQHYAPTSLTRLGPKHDPYFDVYTVRLASSRTS